MLDVNLFICSEAVFEILSILLKSRNSVKIVLFIFFFFLLKTPL